MVASFFLEASPNLLNIKKMSIFTIVLTVKLHY